MIKKLALMTTVACAALAMSSLSAQAQTQTTTTSHSQETDTTYVAPQTATTTYQSAPAQHNDSSDYFNGIYVGGQGGYDYTNTGANGPHFDTEGWDYGAFAGYSLNSYFNDMGWGLTGAVEGNYTWSTAGDHTSFDGISLKDYKQNSWGVDFRPGLTYVDQYLPFGLKPYGIFGYQRADYRFSGDGANDSLHFNGFKLGIGTEILTFQHFGVRLDYDHVFYGSRDGVDPHENDLLAGVVFHF
jgi:hypothetical protein